MWERRAFPWLFAVAIAANLLELFSLTLLGWNGNAGVNVDPRYAVKHHTLPIHVVTDPAKSAQIRPGDAFNVSELFSANEYRMPAPGTPYVLVAHRGTQTIRATVIPEPAWIGWDIILRLVAVCWVLSFALLIFVKAARTEENACLALILTLLAFQSAIPRTIFPDVRTLVGYEFIWTPVFAAMSLLLVRYSALFGRPVASWRRRVIAVCTCMIVLLSVLDCIKTWTDMAPFFSPGFDSLATLIDTAGRFIFVLLLLAMLCVASAVPSSAPEERQRLWWVVAAFIPFLIGWAASNLSGYNAFFLVLRNLSLFFVPAGLTYAALARRLFDIGFVLNRAAVFTGVSAIVVGAFVLLEWSLGQWFEGLSHASSLAINGSLALVVGISFRVIHGYVDRAVDTIFFRKRHENEMALRRFAREAAFFTSEAALLERTLATILAHSEVSSARIVFTKELDDNDPAVIAMKTWQEPVDLSARGSSIEGELAFPMLVHGSLLGAIVCGTKTTGEQFAPDERETLQDLAHGVGLALDGMARRVPEDGALLRMEHRMYLLTQSIDTLVERFGAATE